MFKNILDKDLPLIFRDAVVILDGIPYYISGFIGSRAECLNIGTQDYENIMFSDVKSIKIPNTGYFNQRGVTCYLERNPLRRFKHGLSKENISVKFSNEEYDENYLHKARGVADTVRRLSSKDHYSLFMNIYPSLEEAIDQLQDGAYSIAFDRQFAIDFNGKIFYKTKAVGKWSADKSKIVFNRQYEYLAIALPKGLK